MRLKPARLLIEQLVDNGQKNPVVLHEVRGLLVSMVDDPNDVPSDEIILEWIENYRNPPQPWASEKFIPDTEVPDF